MTPFKKPRISKCIFCDRKANSDEHFWSDWMKAHLPRDAKKWHGIVITEKSDGRINEPFGRAGDPHAWRIRCVCSQCNNGWMSRLEIINRRVLTSLITSTSGGSAFSLSVKEKRQLSRWCLMKAIVSQFSNPSWATVDPRHQKRMAWDDWLPRKGWRIWIGHYPRDTWDGQWRDLAVHVSDDPNQRNKPKPESLPYNTRSTLWLIGNLMVLAISSRATKMIDKLTMPLEAEARLRRILPLQNSSLRWPPPALDRKTAEAIATVLPRRAGIQDGTMGLD